MKVRLLHTLAAAALTAMLVPTQVFAANATSDAAGGTTSEAIRDQLQRYERSLNAADTDAVMQLYAKDAVFMPQHSLPSVGQSAVRLAYEQVFKAIKLNIHFEIDEVQQLDNDWAYARTRSTGTVKLQGSKLPAGPESNQELFLLHREADGVWRFARYIFSTTLAPQLSNTPQAQGDSK
jgi:uncharacterized protein (TIGR02246 family)